MEFNYYFTLKPLQVVVDSELFASIRTILNIYMYVVIFQWCYDEVVNL